MDEKQQAMLAYLLGKGLQQEERRSHIVKQQETDYRRGQARIIRVPTHEELEAERARAAATKEGRSLQPPAFTPMQWSELQKAAAPKTKEPPVRPAAQEPGRAACLPAAAPVPRPEGRRAARKVSAPLWEKVKRQ